MSWVAAPSASVTTSYESCPRAWFRYGRSGRGLRAAWSVHLPVSASYRLTARTAGKFGAGAQPLCPHAGPPRSRWPPDVDRPVGAAVVVRQLTLRSSDVRRADGALPRHTPLLQQLVEMAAERFTGRGGSRFLRIVNVPLSRTSVLFHLMRMPLPSTATPQVPGRPTSRCTPMSTAPC